MSIKENVQTLIALAEEGKFMEAIQQFYAEDATMQENNAPPRVGLAALLENERSLLGSQLRTEQGLQCGHIEGLHTLDRHTRSSTS